MYLYIKVLENFKSYAGIKTIGPFHKCFSSVVGPNGSGKSNVIDAMLFVFGKKAKKLRLNKVSELIHSSDACLTNPPQYTKVSVYLHEIIDTGDGDDDYDVVPNTSVVVSRVARVDNTSQYQIDGRNSTFKQVADYLGTRGIDLDNNRFLILQGEVEMISMMPPKGKTDGDEGLLEYLEDIIGINKYVEAANIAAAKVEQLGEVRQERLHRVRAAEKEKDGLSSAKAEAEALVSKDREIRRKKNVLYQIYSMYARNEGDEAGTERTELLTKLNEDHTKLVEADNRVAEIENGMSDQKKEYDDVYAELTETKEAYASYERQDIQMRENMKHEKTTIKKLEDKVAGEMKKMEDAQLAMVDAETSIPTLEEQITECTERRAAEDSKLEVILDETKSITETLRLELEAKSHELAPMQQERTVYQNSLDTAQMEVDLLEDGVSRALEQLTNAERELSELDGRQRDTRTKLKECETELTVSKARVSKAEVELQDLGPKETALAKKSIDLVTQVEIARSSMQQSATGLSRVASAIIKASKKGGDLANCGVMGRLGDLATIDEQYDVAVSTACGMLDHIVVQTTAGTQKCLEHLRAHNLGRASFVPLDKMKKGAFDRAVETPEGAPRLFDLICPGHAAIAPALYLAVGDTLVAPDLETATRWAYDFGKRWRVVTVDGKLIETSGTMSGGGNSVQKGKMKLSNDKTKGVASTTNVGGGDTSPEELKQLEEEAKVAQDELKACRDRRRELIEEIRTLNKLIKTHSVKLPKLRMEIEGFDTTREVLTKQLPTLREQSTLSAIDEAKKSELLKKVVKCKSEMSACVAATSKLEAEVAKLQKNIVTAGGARLTNQQKACDKAKKDLNDANKELAAAKSTITNSKKIIIKAEKAKEMAETDLQRSREALETIQAEHVGLEGQAKEVMEAYEQVKKDEAEKRQALALVSKECEKLKQAQQKLKCAEVELHAKIETLDKQVKDCEKKVMHWDREVEQLCKVEKQEEIDYDFSDDEDEGEEEGDDTKKSGCKTKEADAEEGDEDDDVMNDDGKVVDDKDSPNIDESKETKTKTSTNKSSLPKLADSSLEQYSMESVKSDIAILEKERDTLAKNANMGAIAEYRKKEADYLSRYVCEILYIVS
jgi:structural maintenance of chromosome 4